MKIIHLSDLHIGCKERDVLLKTHFDETIDYLKNNIEQPEEHIIIVTGDITHNANKDGFEYAANSFKNLKTLGFRVLVVPGNHDYRVKDKHSGSIEDGEQARKIFCDSFYDGDTEFPKKNILEFTKNTGHTEKIAFIGIDSDEDKLDGSKGKIGEKQRRELNKKLKLPEVQQCDLKVIYLHHNPFAHRLSFWGMKLKDRKEFIRILKRHNISLLLYGHTHSKSFKINKKNIGLSIDGGTTTGRGRNNTPARIIDITTIDFESINDFEKEDIESHFTYIKEDWRE
jgi:3',5'-cyclic AMP phosphodiesterase CpdA